MTTVQAQAVSDRIISKANGVTILRLPLGLIVAVGLASASDLSRHQGSTLRDWIGVFCLVAALDKVDGWLARRENNGITSTGKWLDPIVDKLFFHGCMLGLVVRLLMSAVPYPEFLLLSALGVGLLGLDVASSKMYFDGLRRGSVTGANRYGQYKTLAALATVGIGYSGIWLRLAPASTTLACVASMVVAIICATKSIKMKRSQ